MATTHLSSMVGPFTFVEYLRCVLFELPTGLQILPAWQQQFLNPHGKTLGVQYPFAVRDIAKSSSIIGIITSAQVIGSLAVRRNIDLCHIGRLTCCFYKGLPLAPYCSDRFGRRVTLVLGAVLILGGVASQATASTVGQFVMARMLG